RTAAAAPSASTAASPGRWSAASCGAAGGACGARRPYPRSRRARRPRLAAGPWSSGRLRPRGSGGTVPPGKRPRGSGGTVPPGKRPRGSGGTVPPGKREHWLDPYLGQQPAVRPQLANRAGDPQWHRRREVPARSAEPQLDVAWLDDAPAIDPGERGEVGGHGEIHACGRARIELYAAVPDQPDHRPGGLRDRVVQVELDDLGAVPPPGITDRHVDGGLAVHGPADALGGA